MPTIHGLAAKAVAYIACQAFTLTPWGYTFIRYIDCILSFRDHGGDRSELESSDS